MPIYHKVDARSQAWFWMRLGVPTASEFHRILTPGGKISTQAEGYAHILMAEAMLGHPLDSVETQWMVRGQELEDEAIKAYEFEASVETEPGGFVTDDAATYGCSPDRLVGDDGILEMKCPAPNTHLGYLLEPASMCKDKWPQVQGQLLVTGRKFVDLMSYHPELPAVVSRVEQDEKYIGLLRTALCTFTEQLRLMRAKLVEQYGPFPDLTIKPEVHEDTFGITDADVDLILSSRGPQ